MRLLFSYGNSDYRIFRQKYEFKISSKIFDALRLDVQTVNHSIALHNSVIFTKIADAKTLISC